MLLEQGRPRRLGNPATARLALRAETPATGLDAPGRRLLWLDGDPAFELSYWCGSCPYLFQRLEGARATTSLDDLEDRLARGLDDVDDDAVMRFGELLPPGEYQPLLLQVQPRLVRPDRPGDYFVEEQVDTWGIDPFWGLPQHPRTPYYRTFETRVDEGAHLFEFVVPMVPPSMNDRARVVQHAARLAATSTPTAVAVGVLDVCEPVDAEQSDCPYAHWALAHFLLDGHHKLQAAAELGRPLQLLSLLSLTDSLASAAHLARVPELRRRRSAPRGATAQP